MAAHSVLLHDPVFPAETEPSLELICQLATRPAISVIIVNYNGAYWLERCLTSLRNQTIASQLEIIVADNGSLDQSDHLAAGLMRGWARGYVLRNGQNLGYTAANNQAAKLAQGRHLLFLNHDTWLEPDCLEQLLQAVAATGAMAATPLVLDYVGDRMQGCGGGGFDLFGLPLPGPVKYLDRQEIFYANGAAFLVDRICFQSLGGFDSELFMYGEEFDLSWRVQIAGGKVILVSAARLHHRGAVTVNPLGGEQILEKRTSETKRYYANRNGLLALLKNCQHLLLLMLPPQLLLLGLEAFVMAALTRRWSYARRTWVDAIRDCWRLRRHILAERRRLEPLRRHSDWWMLRFLHLQLNRWHEIQNCRRFGFPRVDSK